MIGACGRHLGPMTTIGRLLLWLVITFVLVPTVFCSTTSGVNAGNNVGRSMRDALAGARPHLVAGAVARFASISACYPLDTIKTRLQMGGVGAASSLKGGIAGLYMGVGGSLFGQVPYGMLTFGTYAVYKKALLKRFKNVPPAVTFCAAAILGDLTGGLWLVPSEVVKVQMQGGMHTSVTAATLSIWKSSGFAGFYQGYSGQVVRDVPFRAIQLTSYELLRSLLQTWRQRNARFVVHNNNNSGRSARVISGAGARGGSAAGPSTSSSADAAALGGVAGMISAVFTCPLDVVRTRLMAGVQQSGSAAAAAAGAGGGAGAWKAAIAEGGLFAGLGTRVVFIGVSSALFFLVYEGVMNHFFYADDAQGGAQGDATTTAIAGGGGVVAKYE